MFGRSKKLFFWQTETLPVSRCVCRPAPGDLYFLFDPRPLIESGAATLHAQAYIPAESAQTFQSPRVPHSYEDQEWAGRDFAPPCQGTQARLGEAWLP